jgi:hypothetical protein
MEGAMRGAQLVLIIGVLGLAACSMGGEREPRTLHNLRTSGEPEEFGIVPNKPLETPVNFAELPQPTPGGANRTDQTPVADAVAALGGNPARLQAGSGIGAGDQAIVQTASRFGRDENIRTTLAAEDEDYRRRKSRFSWSIVPDDDYNNAYKRQTLDPYFWLRKYRASGVPTPSAPVSQ